MKVRATMVGLLVAGWVLPLGAGEKLTMRVSPEVSFAPAHLIVRTMIDSDKANRAIEIIAESSDFYRSSVIELDGDRAPRTSEVEFRSLPGGQYDVSATLIDASGEPRAYERRQVQVLAGGER